MAFDPLSWVADLGSGILNTATGWIAQNHQNKVNAREAAKQRDWESNEAQKQRDYSTQMWNMNNAYNTPEAQRQRLQAAGYNPNIRDTQNVGNGVATSPGSTPSGAFASTPLSPQNGVFGSNVAKFAESGLMKMQRTNLNLINDKQVLDNVTSMRKRGFSSEAIDSYLSSYFGSSARERRNFDKEYDMFIAQSDRVDLDNEFKRIENFIYNNYGEKTAFENVRKLKQEVNLLTSQTNLTDQQKRESIKRCVEILASAYKLVKEGDKYVAETQTINAMRKDLISMLNLQKNILDMDEQDRRSRFENEEGLRGYLTSREGKKDTQKSYSFKNDYKFQDASKIVELTDDVLFDLILLRSGVPKSKAKPVSGFRP